MGWHPAHVLRGQQEAELSKAGRQALAAQSVSLPESVHVTPMWTVFTFNQQPAHKSTLTPPQHTHTHNNCTTHQHTLTVHARVEAGP